MNRMRILLAFIIIGGLSFTGRAQYSYNGSINPSVSISTVVAFTLTSNSSPTIIFNNASDYISGYTVSNFSTIAVKANVAWNLYISSSTANFSNSGAYSTTNTPASILQYNIEGKSARVVLSNVAKLLNSGAPGPASDAGNTFNIGFTSNPGYNYGPGTYTISTVYTLSAQ
jgi:hypothetical protein